MSVRRVLLRLLVAIPLGLAIAVGVDVVRSGGPETWLAARGLGPPYVAQGEQVALPDGRSLYLDCRGSGSPTVVLENGLGSGASGWGFVLPKVADRTRTCAYDRAGIGRSESGPRQTVSDAVADLRELLAAAGERPPYVLVGMSLGGSHVRVFASAHPEEVVGVALVDAYMPDVTLPAAASLDPVIRADWQADVDATAALIERVEALDWAASVEEVRATKLEGIPVEALFVPPRYRFVHERLDPSVQAALIADWEAWIADLSPGRTRLTIAERSGHVIQMDRPDLVIDAIGRLVERSRG